LIVSLYNVVDGFGLIGFLGSILEQEKQSTIKKNK
jgi:hypothetical protein